MTATIIIPSDKSKSLIKYVKNCCDKNDKIHILQNKYLNFKINEIILKSKFTCIIIFNPYFVNFETNYIKEIKEKFKDDKQKVILCNKDENKIYENSAIAFNKKYFKEFNKKIFNTLNIEKKILSTFNWNVNLIPLKNSDQEINEQIQKIKNDENNKSRRQKIEEKNKKTALPSQKQQKVVKFGDFYKRKPKILLICDVEAWAWWIKAKYLKKYLQDYYDIDIIHVIGKGKKKIDPKKYDLYFTFGYSYVNNIMSAPLQRRISGITAHRPWAALEKQMKKVFATHANSVLLYNELKQIHYNPFYVPNGVDTDLFYEKIPVMNDHKKPIIGHVGKKGKMKNQNTIIEPAIQKANIDYIGHYNDYTNKIPHSQMVDKHNAYDVFIAASDEDGTPNGMLESAACGRPIIINKIGNAPEFVKDDYNGFIVEKKIDDYVDAMKWFQKNPDKIYEMGQNAKKEIQKWTWELMSKNYKIMFDSILGIQRDKEEYENPALYHIK